MVRLAIGLTSLMLCMLFAAHALGLVPDREGAVIAGRKALCETVAIHCASLVSRPDDISSLRVVLAAIRQRNPDIQSAGLRNAAGQLLVSAGDHETPWREAAVPNCRSDGIRATLLHGSGTNRDKNAGGPLRGR